MHNPSNQSGETVQILGMQMAQDVHAGKQQNLHLIS